jgi:multicomponent Na+:H+ antiporter subunit D
LAGRIVTSLLLWAGAATIGVASLIALRQDQLKRRLAYSTIAHLSYIVVGFTLLSRNGTDGALLHILNHGALKITLFFCAGAIYVHLHLDRVSQLDGIGRRMPFTMSAFAVASLGLAGLPPMGGFVSKWRLSLGAFDADAPLVGIIMIGSGLLTAAYLFPIVHRAFFRPSPDEAPAEPAADPGEAGPVTVAGDGAESVGQLVATPPARRRRDWTDAPPLVVLPLCATAGLGLALGRGDWAGLYHLASTVAGEVAGVMPGGGR